MKKLTAILLSLLLVFVLASCSMENDSSAVVSFDINESSARGISVVDMETAYYIVEGSGPSSFNSGKINVDTASASFTLVPGDWTFKASAYNDEGQKIGESDSLTRNIHSGANESISLVVRELSGTGKVTFSISYKNEDRPDTELYLQIDDGEKQILAADNGTYTLTCEIENGFHEVFIYEGTSSEPSYMTTVRVVTGYDTRVEMEYVSSSFGNGYFEITGDITKTPVITLKPSINATAIPVNISFTVDSSVEEFSGGISYQWFINGILIPDAVSSTLSVSSLNDLASSLNAGSIEAGTKLAIVLKVESGDVAWTSDAFTFTVASAVDFPKVSVSTEEYNWSYSAGAQDVAVNIEGETEGFEIRYFVDGDSEIAISGSTLSIDPSAYTVGPHTVSYIISSQSLGISNEGELFSFTVIPSVSLSLGDTSLESYEYLTGTVNAEPVGNYKVTVSVGDGIVTEDLIITDSSSAQFSFPLGYITETGDYDVQAVVYTLDGVELAASGIQSVNVSVPAIAITTDSLKIYQGQDLKITGQDNSSVAGDYQWMIDSGVLEGYNSDSLYLYGISWPVGEYTIQLIKGEEKSNPLTIEIIEEPDITLLVNGDELYYDDWSKGEPLTLSISNPDSAELSNITWSINGGDPTYIGQTSVTFEAPDFDYCDFTVSFDVNGIPYVISGSVHDYSSSDSYIEPYLEFDQLVVEPGETVILNYGIGEYDYYTGQPIESATITLYRIAESEGSVAVGEPVIIDSFPAEGNVSFELTEEGSYYAQFSIKTGYSEPYYSSSASLVYCTSDNIIPIKADDVYQTIVLDSDGNATAGTGTILIDRSDMRFAYYYVEFTEEMLDAMVEGSENVPNPMTVDAGSVVISGNKVEMTGENGTYTLTGSGTVYQDDAGHEWKKLNAVSSRAIGDYTGKWSLVEIRPSAAFMNKAYEIGKGYLESYVDPEKPWDALVSFDEGEGIGVNAGLEIRQDGNFNIFARVDLDFSALDTGSTSISLADDMEILGMMSGEISSYGKNEMLRIGDENFPMAIQKSSDGSVLILYVLYDTGEGYEAMFALPLTKTTSLSIPGIGKDAFDETLVFSMNDLLDTAVEAEDRLGQAGSDLLYELFDMSDSGAEFSFMRTNGIWNVAVDAEVGSEAVIKDIFGDRLISFMGELYFESGEYLEEYYGGDLNGRVCNYAIYGEHGSVIGINITEVSDGVINVEVMYDYLPTVYEGTLTLTRQENVSFTELVREMTAMTTPLDSFFFEFRNNGEMWMSFPGENAMHVCDYSISDGQITILTTSDLIHDLNGLSVIVGGTLPYEETGEGVRINILEDQNKQPIGVTLTPGQV